MIDGKLVYAEDGYDDYKRIRYRAIRHNLCCLREDKTVKYSDLISFNPIEDVIQLVTADDSNKAREYVKTYIMSDVMVQSLKSPVLEQLQMDEVVDNKGVLVVGNYGTGKSHLMSVISAIAKDADNLQYLQNKKFAEEMECIAGKFEVPSHRNRRNKNVPV